MREFWRMPLTVEMFGRSYLTKKGWALVCLGQVVCVVAIVLVAP